jgi:DNA-binding SARP family transcriptional activator
MLRQAGSMESREGRLHQRRERYRSIARRAAQRAVLRARRTPSTPLRHAQATLPALDIEPSPPTRAAVEIRCFGRFEVLREGVAVQRWRRHAAKKLLKILVVQRRPVHRDVLLDALWPDAPQDASINSLRVALHALRRVLDPSGTVHGSGEGSVLRIGDTYLLDPTARLSVDAEEFLSHVRAANSLERRLDLEGAAREYTLAEGLYRDDFLIEDLYEEWTVLRREELKDHYLLVLTKLAQHCLNEQDWDGCIERCHRLLEKEPCREDAYQRLMLCYTRLGQRSRATHWYEVCERTLRIELDVAPSDETRRQFDELCGPELSPVGRTARARVGQA